MVVGEVWVQFCVKTHLWSKLFDPQTCHFVWELVRLIFPYTWLWHTSASTYSCTLVAGYGFIHKPSYYHHLNQRALYFWPFFMDHFDLARLLYWRYKQINKKMRSLLRKQYSSQFQRAGGAAAINVWVHKRVFLTFAIITETIAFYVRIVNKPTGRC